MPQRVVIASTLTHAAAIPFEPSVLPPNRGPLPTLTFLVLPTRIAREVRHKAYRNSCACPVSTSCLPDYSAFPAHAAFSRLSSNKRQQTIVTRLSSDSHHLFIGTSTHARACVSYRPSDAVGGRSIRRETRPRSHQPVRLAKLHARSAQNGGAQPTPCEPRRRTATHAPSLSRTPCFLFLFSTAVRAQKTSWREGDKHGRLALAASRKR